MSPAAAAILRSPPPAANAEPGVLRPGPALAGAGARGRGLEINFQKLKFPDASFDVVLSTFGVMFAPNQQQAAAEMLRVCKPGGSACPTGHQKGGSVTCFG